MFSIHFNKIKVQSFDRIMCNELYYNYYTTKVETTQK